MVKDDEAEGAGEGRQDATDEEIGLVSDAAAAVSEDEDTMAYGGENTTGCRYGLRRGTTTTSTSSLRTCRG